MSNQKDMHEGAEERALRTGLRANALSPEALQRIREATQAEWRASTAPAKRRWMPIATAASFVAAALIGWTFWQSNPADGAVFAQVIRADSPGLVEVRYLRRDQAVATGSQLHAGQSLDARGDALLAMQGGGNVRVARASAFTVESADMIKLERGEVYVDIPPQAHANAAFVVITPAGEFRHLGTQFAVALVDGGTRLRVREGRVQWHASGGESTVDAGTEMLIDSQRRVTRRSMDTSGRDWAWVETLAPDVDIDNRPVSEFLAWFSRETGRKLVFADDAARLQADAIRMRGDIKGLSAMEALSAVMASTSLRFELPAGAIRVSSARELSVPAT